MLLTSVYMISLLPRVTGLSRERLLPTISHLRITTCTPLAGDSLQFLLVSSPLLGTQHTTNDA